MMAALSAFHFLRPWWLLALLALPLLWRALGRSAGVARAWAQAVDAHLLPHLLVGAERPLRLPRALIGASLVIATLALAGPAWERLPAPLYRNQAARVIALELAPSMLSPDLKPDRLSRARYKIHDLLQRLGDGQVALLAYSGDAFVVAPLTEDANTVDALLDALDPTTMPVIGNATDVAIERAVALIKQAGQSHGDVLLVADSVNARASAAASEARAQGVAVSVLAVGTAQGAPVSLPGGGFLKDTAGNIVVPKLEGGALQSLAQIGGGRYAELSADARDLESLTAGNAAPSASLADTSSAQTDAWRDRGPWLVWLLLPLAALGFRRGWLALLAFAFVLPQPAHAFDWSDLWQRSDQQAWQALQDKQPKTAASVAKDPALRGAGEYQAGDYEKAIEDFAQGKDADADYNRGNALAQSQQYDEAVEAYESALAKDPNHADARANRDAVKEFQKQQKKQPQDSQNQQGNSGDKQKQDSQKQSGDQKDSQQKSDQQQESSQDQKQDGKNESADKKDQQAKPGDSEQKDHAGHEGESKTEQQQAAQQAQQREEAQRKAMEQALQQGKPDKDAKPKELPAQAPQESEEQREQRQAMEQWLQRVPDDPGGLLRRKFQLEYERRQQTGGKGDR